MKVFPGLASDGLPVAPLVDHCKALGYAAIDWGSGVNTGPGANIDAWLQGLAVELNGVLNAAVPTGAPPAAPTLIRSSLGGIYARELAKLPGFAVR